MCTSIHFPPCRHKQMDTWKQYECMCLSRSLFSTLPQQYKQVTLRTLGWHSLICRLSSSSLPHMLAHNGHWCQEHTSVPWTGTPATSGPVGGVSGTTSVLVAPAFTYLFSARCGLLLARMFLNFFPQSVCIIWLSYSL